MRRTGDDLALGQLEGGMAEPGTVGPQRRGVADGADADDRGRLDAFNSIRKVTGGSVPVGVGLLEINQIRTRRLQQPVDVEHIHPRLSLWEGHPVLNQRRTKEVGEADACRARAEEQILLIAEPLALDLS